MDDAQAEEIIERLLKLSKRMRSHFEATTAELGLTPAEGQTLHSLVAPAPMRAMADALQCDASYVTMLTDRLEQAGLVNRVNDPADRRVKQLVISGKGSELRQMLMERIHTGSPALKGLDGAERQQLLDLLRKLTAI